MEKLIKHRYFVGIAAVAIFVVYNAPSWITSFSTAHAPVSASNPSGLRDGNSPPASAGAMGQPPPIQSSPAQLLPGPNPGAQSGSSIGAPDAAKSFLGKWSGIVIPSNRDKCYFTAEINQHPEAPNKLFAYSRLDCSANIAMLYLQNRPSDPAAKKFLPESTISSADLKDGPIRFDIISNIGSGCPVGTLTFTPFGSSALSAEFEDECGHGDLILQRAR
jgi:hypothetical protein